MALPFSPSFVNLLGFKIISMDRASVINFGPSLQNALNNFAKTNAGSGSSFGDFTFSPQGASAVFDPDAVDSPEAKASAL
ncbi:MAG: spore germination protein [Desulfotomaculales bacterium]